MQCKEHTLSFERTLVMGILNVTPDSFSDGGRYLSMEAAVARARQMIDEGADIIDVGGESSRPGAAPIPVEEELVRVLPVVEQICRMGVPISIDTCHPEVADIVLNAGAHLVNDISGMSEGMQIIVKKHRVPVIIMHMQGRPKDMQRNPSYTDVVAEIKEFFQEKLNRYDGDIILDPGIGFGKNLEHNIALLQRLGEFTSFGKPLLVGVSRKSFINAIFPSQVEERLPGTLAANTVAILNGANIIRVHDVREAVQAARVAEALRLV